MTRPSSTLLPPRLPAPAPRHRRARGLLAAAVAALLAGGWAAHAADPEPQAFFDAFFAELMKGQNVPGAAVVMVRDDQVVFRAGYGSTDLTGRTRIDPDRTIFPLGSISNILTTVAVLQLVDEQRLDPQTDIGRYLAVEPRDRRFTAPVTLHHLLTHTDGYDPRWLFGSAARVPGKVRPLADLVAELPPRIAPPGELYLYSDVGITLAGHIVERVAGVPFARYMEERVFLPLGMRGTSFRADRPDYSRQRASGHDHDAAGRLVAVPVAYPHASPAWGVTAPASDLAPLMIALLRPADAPGATVLRQDSLRAVTHRQFTHDPLIPGTAYGFYETFHGGRRALVHGGLVPGFTSMLVMLPEARIGFFVAANRFDLTGAFENRLVHQFIDRFAPAAGPPPVLQPTESSGLGAKQLDGRYRSDQYSRHSTDKLVLVAGLVNELEIATLPDGRLKFTPGDDVWRPIGPARFEHETTGERILFRLDAAGRATRIVGSAHFMSYHRVSWFERLDTQAVLAGSLSLLCAVTGFVAFWIAVRAWFKGDISPGRLRVARRLAMLTGAGVAGYALAFAFMAWRMDLTTVVFAEPRQITALRYLPTVLGLLALAQGAAALLGAFAQHGRRELLVYLAGAVALIGLLPVLDFWNLLHPSLSVP